MWAEGLGWSYGNLLSMCVVGLPIVVCRLISTRPFAVGGVGDFANVAVVVPEITYKHSFRNCIIDGDHCHVIMRLHDDYTSAV